MRKTKLGELNPKFVSYRSPDQTEIDGPIDALYFECPEGHAGCWHRIRFTPALDGVVVPPQRNGAIWTRVGEDFETLSLQPSIRNTPPYASYDDAIARGAIPEHVTPRLLCAMHIFITNGVIEFCGDSR